MGEKVQNQNQLLAIYCSSYGRTHLISNYLTTDCSVIDYTSNDSTFLKQTNQQTKTQQQKTNKQKIKRKTKTKSLGLDSFKFAFALKELENVLTCARDYSKTSLLTR